MPFGRGRGQDRGRGRGRSQNRGGIISLHILMEGATIRIKAKAKAAASEVDNNMLMDKDMTNPTSSVIIAKNMGIMTMSVGKRNMT